MSRPHAIDLSHRPVAFMFRYVRGHALAHVVVLLSVVAAVACSVGSQYAIKHLVDTLTRPRA